MFASCSTPTVPRYFTPINPSCAWTGSFRVNKVNTMVSDVLLVSPFNSVHDNCIRKSRSLYSTIKSVNFLSHVNVTVRWNDGNFKCILCLLNKPHFTGLARKNIQVNSANFRMKLSMGPNPLVGRILGISNSVIYLFASSQNLQIQGVMPFYYI